MAYLPLKDVTIYYEVEGEGFPIVLIHGMGLSHVNWRGQVEYFTKHGYQTITLDIRGHGRSTETLQMNKHKNIINQLTEDVYKLLTKLSIKEAVFAGYSTGTVIVQNFTLTYPELVRGIVLSGAFPKIHNLYLFGKFISSISLAYLKLRKPLEKGVARSNGKDEDQINLFHKEAKKVRRKEAIRLLRASLDFDCRDRLKEIQVPILVTYGGNERYMMTYRHDYLLEAPTAEVCLFPNVNHATLTKSEEKYNQVLLDFIEKVTIQEKPLDYFLNPRMMNPTPNPINKSLE
ncbi:alpha/beta fold hydrolase [Caldalkalibacillus mannanilyticus]|uniref:alpha/beta fold hydrolase n=1 Tax=Caldalkalibacillus mannanilyticus TaxID=1418 RepID=UPI000469A4A7|nr:alpha/beta hydrolase [Caldalkalibacillus mannanilyticus]